MLDEYDISGKPIWRPIQDTLRAILCGVVLIGMCVEMWMSFDWWSIILIIVVVGGMAS